MTPVGVITRPHHLAFVVYKQILSRPRKRPYSANVPYTRSSTTRNSSIVSAYIKRSSTQASTWLYNKSALRIIFSTDC
ncbi:hypothetical protein PHMEG_00030492 [Phytophthora megakarya]|uniref:Uncharacterized protein n=1 Tax=Phytophthora megakarya TaxID=4795 RepID=A0A225V0F4_9STRA|nr:hypothetical protein PHMEG_00030492 [Phytophthora megakarya]